MVGHEFNDKLKIITNCVPDTDYQCVEKTNSIVWCGSFNIRIKRPDLMLRIWKDLYADFPTWNLYMVGDGNDIEEVKRYAESLNVKNVIFTGRISPKQLFDTAKITCVTSTHETFSLVSVEGMISNMPVIAFDSFTMAKELIIDDLNGYLIDDFSVKKYTEKLRFLMSNESLRTQMGNNAHMFSQKFKTDSIYEIWNDFLRSIE